SRDAPVAAARGHHGRAVSGGRRWHRVVRVLRTATVPGAAATLTGMGIFDVPGAGCRACVAVPGPDHRTGIPVRRTPRVYAARPRRGSPILLAGHTVGGAR